jgi:hypothetical protein
MSSREGYKRGNAIPESRAQDVHATDDMIVHGVTPSIRGRMAFSSISPLLLNLNYCVN